MLSRKEKQDYFLKKQKEDMEKLISKKVILYIYIYIIDNTLFLY